MQIPYADDISLLSEDVAGLQLLIELDEFCSMTGPEISLTKTKVMQFLPRPRRGPPPSLHSFTLGAVVLENVESHRYLGVDFKSSGNPAHYMPAARGKITAAYHVMRQKSCGLACGVNVRLQLSFFAACVTSMALYGGELWGCHPRTIVERRKTSQLHVKHLRQLLRLSPSVCTSSLLSELQEMPLQTKWIVSCLKFWNRVVSLPEGDLFRDVLFDSAYRDVGFAAGLRQACSMSCMLSPTGQLQPVDVSCILARVRVQEARSVGPVDVDPRWCPSAGASACKYQRWFERPADVQHGRLGGTIHCHAGTSTRAHELFRLGCHALPCIMGRRTQTPRHERLCQMCSAGLGDGKHVIFECFALENIRDSYRHLFRNRCTMASFMNQPAQRDVMYFVTDCLRYISDSV